jgi:hypothetical protein
MQVDEKWNVLQLVNDWVKYSDTKSALVLGFQGSVAGFFFAQRSDFVGMAARYGGFTEFCFGISIVLLVASIFLSAFAVYPRLRVGESTSNIFFAHIGQLPTAADYRSRVAKPAHLFDADIENQIWANSRIAWKKYRLNSFSIAGGIASYGALAVTALSGWVSIKM